MEGRDWITYWMDIAIQKSRLSTCASGRRVGAVIIRDLDRKLLTSGFNGPPVGYPRPQMCVRRESGQDSGNGLWMCPCIHAEGACLASSVKEGINLNKSTIYTTTEPCDACMGLLSNAGIRKVIFKDSYPNIHSKDIVQYTGIEVIKYNDVLA